MIKVSVILPNYNHELFLDQRIHSIINQTYKDFELIVLDDNSSDSSKNIIEKYRDHPKVSHIIYNVNNSGSTFRQWEKGFLLAKGEYIWIAESDDYCSLDFLKICMDKVEKSKNSSIVYSNSVKVNERNEIITRKKTLTQYWLQPKKNSIECYKAGQFAYYMIFENSIINASAVVFRKKSIPQDSCYINYKYCGDWLFWCNVMRGGDVLFINQKLNFFRQHSNKVSPLSEKKGLSFIEGIEVYNKILSMYSIGKFYQKASIGSFFYRIIRSNKIESKELKKSIYALWKQKYHHPYLYVFYYLIYLIMFRVLRKRPIS